MCHAGKVEGRQAGQVPSYLLHTQGEGLALHKLHQVLDLHLALGLCSTCQLLGSRWQQLENAPRELQQAVPNARSWQRPRGPFAPTAGRPDTGCATQQPQVRSCNCHLALPLPRTAPLLPLTQRFNTRLVPYRGRSGLGIAFRVSQC